MFDKIPAELRAYRQWVVWRFEARDGAKDTKVPYCPLTGRKASVTDPSTWVSFDEAVEVYRAHGGQTDSSMPGLAGIGFVLTKSDPFGFIDLDDTHGDQVAYERQVKIYNEFDSYSELSPSGVGLHIIVKGAVPHGRKRSAIEVYSDERYMTMTGNVVHDRPFAERNELLNVLWDEMGGPAQTHVYGEQQEQKLSDEEVLETAYRAANGEKFANLYNGNWQNDPAYAHEGQSAADQALMNILAYYTQNKAQLMRLFRESALGQRQKAQRDKYLDYTINKAFDRNLPPLDIEGLLIAFKNMVAANPKAEIYVNAQPVTTLTHMPQGGSVAGEPGGTPATLADNGSLNAASPGPASGQGQASPSPCSPSPSSAFPPGLLGDVAQAIYDMAPRPVAEIALAGAVGFLAGITGRAYNVSGTGLNQYVLLLAPTGTGKEAIAHGTDKLIEAVKAQVPPAGDFVGPGELVSSAGLIKWMQSKPSLYCIVGEFGLKLAEMSSPKANTHLISLKRVMTDLYHKSGAGSVLQPMAYSDKEKNTAQILSPALSLIGESVPERFYEVISEDMVADGLLPRFTIIEYNGPRPPKNELASTVRPRIDLVERLGSLIAQCLTLAHNRTTHHVPATIEAKAIFDRFDKWCDSQINGEGSNEVTRQLWNRAHIKALKMAALVSVGINYVNPVIDHNAAQWACDQIAGQTNKLLAKFATGQVGEGANNEARQCREVIKVITAYMTDPIEKFAKYGANEAMRNSGVVPYDVIQRRLVSMACFRHDRIGATNSIKRSLDLLLTADDLREVPKVQMTELFGRAPRAFSIANPSRFAPEVGV